MLEYAIIVLLIIVALVIIFIAAILLKKNESKRNQHYDDQQFEQNNIYENKNGFDAQGFDCYGYNRDGYNICGKNQKGQYNRLYDKKAFQNCDYSDDGFLNPNIYPIAVTNHARQRMAERMNVNDFEKMNELAYNAYCFGKSARQLKRTSAAQIREREEKYENSVVLIYRNYTYVFSSENVLITVYKNESISL